MFLYNLLKTLGITVELAMRVLTDSDAARLVIVNPGTTARTKHHEIWMQYCRELVLKRLIAVEWISTKAQVADALTKPLDKTTFLRFREELVMEL